MVNKDKTNAQLGLEVAELMRTHGIETPMIDGVVPSVEELTGLYTQVHKALGIDLEDDSIQDTPRRIAKLQVHESMKGLDYDNFPKMTTVENKFYDGMVSVNDMLIMSMCEHHWERIVMRVSIAYVPRKGGKVVGLSKFSRLADFFGSRPIVQERYTQQLFEALKYIMDTDDVAVHVRGIHLCMFARGVKEPCSSTTTTCLGGDFKADMATRKEFMDGVNIALPILPQ